MKLEFILPLSLSSPCLRASVRSGERAFRIYCRARRFRSRHTPCRRPSHDWCLPCPNMSNLPKIISWPGTIRSPPRSFTMNVWINELLLDALPAGVCPETPV